MTLRFQDDSPPRSAVSKLARAAAFTLIPLTILVGDLQFRWTGEHLPELFAFWPWFVGSVGLSLALWAGLINLVRGSRLRLWLLPVVVVPLGMAIVASWRFRTIRKFDPAASVVAFIIEEPMYAFELASGGFSPGWFAGVVMVPLVWLAVALYASAGDVRPRRGRVLSAAAVVAAPLAVWLGWPSVVENPWMPYPSDIRLLKIAEQGVGFYRDGVSSLTIRPAERDEPGPVDDRRRPSVLVILAESLRNDRTELWGSPGRPTTPRMAALERERPEEVFAFQRHTANSAATVGSGMGVLLGEHYAAADERLRRAPVIWQYARAAGMPTFLVSAQPWNWSNLTGFYIDAQPPDHFYDSERLGLAAINDAGGDDLEAADKVVELLEDELPADEPFFGVFQLNAAHFPFLPADDVAWPVDDMRGRYDAAIARTDAAVGEVFDALESSGRLDSTVVIFVSDHGIEIDGADDTAEHRRIRAEEPTMFQGARVSSCEPVFVRTPLMIFVPKPWQDRLGVDAARLARNTGRLTSHVDVLPTVLELWSMTPETSPAGQSLLEPVDADRLVYCFPASRLPQLRGVGVHAADRYVYVRANLSRPHVYDLDTPDVFETRRLGRELDQDDHQILERACRHSPLAESVLQTAKLSDFCAR